MRTLELNKYDLWVVESLGLEELIDDNGYFTGEMVESYSEPRKIRMALYPATGEVIQSQFGQHVDVDMVSSTVDIVLNENSLLFLEEPMGDYTNTYDYKVSSVQKSLNHYQYGLKGGI